jgi:hypothetical protein
MAVEDGLDPADQLGTPEDREDVVAVLALRLGHEHFEPVVEAEQRLRPVAVVDQPVERREQRHPVGDVAVGRVGVRLPAVGRRAHAEGAEPAFSEPALGLPQRQRLGLWEPPVGEVPQSLSVRPPRHRHLTPQMKRREHQPDVP